MVLGSAASFGTVPILAKLAYASGLTAGQTLAFRFALGAFGLLGMAAALRQDPRRLGVRRVLELVALGMFGYASAAGTFFVALLSLPASLAELISYVYPSLVALGASLLGDRLSEGELIGGVTVIGAVVIVQWHRGDAAAPLQPK